MGSFDDAPAPGPGGAGLPRRLAAMLYDSLLLAGLLFSFTLAVVLVRGGAAVAPGTWWFSAALLSIVVVFFAGFWVRGGQTLGMRAWRIRLQRRDGRAATWPFALLRLAAACLALLPFGLGYLWSLLDRDKLCWHDRLSDTRVVRVNEPGTKPRR